MCGKQWISVFLAPGHPRSRGSSNCCVRVRATLIKQQNKKPPHQQQNLMLHNCSMANWPPSAGYRDNHQGAAWWRRGQLHYIIQHRCSHRQTQHHPLYTCICTNTHILIFFSTHQWCSNIMLLHVPCFLCHLGKFIVNNSECCIISTACLTHYNYWNSVS